MSSFNDREQSMLSFSLQIYANFHWNKDDDDSMDIPDFLVNNEIGFRFFVHSRTDYPFITSEGFYRFLSV